MGGGEGRGRGGVGGAGDEGMGVREVKGGRSGGRCACVTDVISK